MSTWIMTIDALDADNNAATLRFADGVYDDPDGYYYEVRIKQAANFKAGAYGSSLVSEASSYGEAVLVNIDGGLDYLADYAVDGRNCTISVVNGITVTPVLMAKVLRFSYEDNNLTILLRSPLEDLGQPHPQNTYAGTNTLPDGLEGVAEDIKGLVKPKVYGMVRNAEPVLVNTARYIYQAHDGLNVTITAVYDRGIALTPGADYSSLDDLQSNPPAAGSFRQYQGYFRVGQPPSGQITFDADSSVNLLGDVMEQLIVEAGYNMQAADKAALNTVGQVGIYLDESVATSDLLNLLTESAGAYWSWDATGAIRAYLLTAPESEEVLIQDYQIIGMTRSAIAAGENGLPVWKVTVHADQVESVQTDLAAGVPETLKSRLANQWRDAVYAIDAVKSRHLLAKDMVIDSALRNLTDAEQVAIRLADLVSVRRDYLQVTAYLAEEVLPAIRVGTQVKLETPKFGYSDGRNFVVIGHTPNVEANKVILELWG